MTSNPPRPPSLDECAVINRAVDDAMTKLLNKLDAELPQCSGNAVAFEKTILTAVCYGIGVRLLAITRAAGADEEAHVRTAMHVTLGVFAGAAIEQHAVSEDEAAEVFARPNPPPSVN